MLVYLKGKSITDKDKNRKFEPFIETNWLHNSKKYGASIDTIPIRIDSSRHIFELKLGIEAKINNNLNLRGNFSQRLSNKEYSDTQAILGVKYLF
ncbi:autotransporter outer membrane beta-barrel domain-containing protein [Arsenophonus endosymbiont of Aleurodicus floccissimus]|uniref:autotransporter outer membrane beta-barrel domain-containing protein n=1 Tax=Arsenophonus endosymbiont of Aleurodicus floccissimus TaxID=2152761 RepID=UPI000E6B3268